MGLSLIILIIIAGFLFFRNNGYYLVIENRETGNTVEYKLPDKNFSLGYTHSVMKTETEEFFVVGDKKQIILEKTVYESYGVGLPFLPDEGEMQVKDGKFILKIEREFPSISMVISPIAEHYLRIQNKKYMLSNILGDKPVKILLKIKKRII
ncbi:MAG: DUF1850 domain-containing protein [Fusobacteriaceae bacterium]|nr:DUF1850 domain-containing protein [Fusobacteriaceae bacterium]